MNFRVAIGLVCLAASLPFTACAQQSSKPMTKTEIEAIVKQYIMEHPEVLVDSVRQMQAREQAKQEQKNKDALSVKQKDIYEDPTSPASKTASAGQVTMVEFFDYRCGYCKKVYPTLQKLMAENDVRIVFKELPILGPDSVVATRAALAAAKQGAYSKFHNALMTSPTPPNADRIHQIAKELGLDADKLKKDMDSPEVEAVINKNRELAQSLGVEATPTFVIGKELIPGALDEAGFKQYIEKAKK